MTNVEAAKILEDCEDRVYDPPCGYHEAVWMACQLLESNSENIVLDEIGAKPCPICGSSPRHWAWNYGAIVECWCKDHRFQCEAKTLKDAVAAWNRRT